MARERKYGSQSGVQNEVDLSFIDEVCSKLSLQKDGLCHYKLSYITLCSFCFFNAIDYSFALLNQSFSHEF